jgi:glycosyltransferase involved in cell wall biosynthesis
MHLESNSAEGAKVGSVPSVSLCICSANRAAVLERCLTSVANGSTLPETVIVSDDSVDGMETLAVCKRFPFVQYFTGPKRGLCANRNAVIGHTRTDYVSLIDDDGIVGRTFLEDLRKILPSLADKTVITGDVLEYGGRTAPSNPRFLGHFGKPYGAQLLQGINLNCNCLPRTAFDGASFDEALSYGYEDMDLCFNLLTQGYRFVHYPELVNQHIPPPRGDVLLYERYYWTQRARFETSMVRYLVWENKPLLACLYFAAAPSHRILYALRHRLWADVPRTLFDITVATRRAIARRFRKK